jgi:hypothetical protein
MPKEILPGNSSDTRISDLDNITIDQFSHQIDNITLKENNIAKYQQVSVLWNLVLFGDRSVKLALMHVTVTFSKLII